MLAVSPSIQILTNLGRSLCITRVLLISNSIFPWRKQWARCGEGFLATVKEALDWRKVKNSAELRVKRQRKKFAQRTLWGASRKVICVGPKLCHQVRQAEVRLRRLRWHLAAGSEVVEGGCELKGLKGVSASWPCHLINGTLLSSTDLQLICRGPRDISV